MCGIGPPARTCMNTPELQEYRCDCNKLLFKATLVDGVVEIKCKRCAKVSTIRSTPTRKTLAHR
jgi:phage FluMu protein Com